MEMKSKGQSVLQWLHFVCENSQVCEGFQTFHRNWKLCRVQDIKLQLIAFHYDVTMLLQNLTCNTIKIKNTEFQCPSSDDKFKMPKTLVGRSCKSSRAKPLEFRLLVARNHQVPMVTNTIVRALFSPHYLHTSLM